MAPANSVVLAPVTGVVTRLGYPYASDMSLRYVEITEGGFAHRLFYVRPSIGFHEDTVAGVTPIGFVQDLTRKYPDGMSNHVHYEIKRDGEYFNPESFGSLPVTQQV